MKRKTHRWFLTASFLVFTNCGDTDASCGDGEESSGVAGCECRIPTDVPTDYPVKDDFSGKDSCNEEAENRCCWTLSRQSDQNAFDCWCRYSEDTASSEACEAYAADKHSRNTFTTVVNNCSADLILR